jgi:hypothetical protein
MDDLYSASLDEYSSGAKVKLIRKEKNIKLCKDYGAMTQHASF